MNLGKSVTKAVIPAAGLGTRFLPATKAMPKEMLPVVDQPAIQYVVEEAVRAGLTDLLMITGRQKRALEDHFDRAPALERRLELKGDLERLEAVQHASSIAPIHYLRQGDPQGLGHAVLCARQHVGDEPFAVILPDMLSRGCMTQMLAAYERHGGNIIAVEEVPEDETHKYGVVAVDAEYDDAAAGRTFRITGMVEKPPQGEAPSNLIISGRYILQPEIFDILSDQEKGAGNEIQLTDAMKRLSASQEFHAMAYEGHTHDTGSKLGFLLANLAYGLDDPELGPPLRAQLRKLLDG